VTVRVAALLARIDALTVRQRVLLLAAGVLVLYALWQVLLMDPLLAAQARAGSGIEARRDAVAALAAQAEAITRRGLADPDAPNRALRDRHRARIAEIDARIAQTAANVIDAGQMAAVLESVLSRSRGLTVIEVRGLGARPLLEPAAEQPELAAAGARSPGAFKHGVRITFAGGYHETLAYLRALEALPWRFFWEGIEFEVQRYPEAIASITVYTLSLDRRWIGV